MPEGAIYVGRPSRWANPFEAASFGQRFAVDAFAVHIAAYFGWEDRAIRRAFYPWPVESRAFEDWIAPLRGHDLACWCPLEDADGNRIPCHADVLLELVNGGGRRG
jgi:hypothetical protein